VEVAVNSVEPITTVDGPWFRQQWKERVEEQRKYGLAVGALIGLRHSVDAATKARIESVLKELGETL
jgi:hypothetical protein